MVKALTTTREDKMVFPEARVIAVKELDNVMLTKALASSFLSKEEAARSAIKVAPSVEWRLIFDALEAAGLISFDAGGR